jgi:hypothetical protein
MKKIRLNPNYQQVIDVKDIDESQSLVKAAKSSKFDSTGYRQDEPLKKRIFYTQPYLTCQNCNTIFFITTDKIKYLDALNNAKHRLSLPIIDTFAHYIEKPSVSSSSLKGSNNEQEFPLVLVESDEKLPPCRNCHKVDGLVHGAHDFTDLIIHKER